MDSSLEGHIPSGTSQSEVLSPYLLRQQEDVRYCTYYFGQQSAFVEVLSTDTVGDQRGAGMTPFAGGQDFFEV